MILAFNFAKFESTQEYAISQKIMPLLTFFLQLYCMIMNFKMENFQIFGLMHVLPITVPFTDAVGKRISISFSLIIITQESVCVCVRACVCVCVLNLTQDGCS